MDMTLHKVDGMWIVRHHGTFGDAVYDLFDTYELPTPWREDEPAEAVLRRIAELNPDKLVGLALNP